MAERIIAIGDIHGCLRALDRLLDELSLTTDDLVIPLGDYVDRGPDSRGVLDRLIDLKTRCQLRPLLGNHEEMMRLVLTGHAGPTDWLRYGGVATLESYGFDGNLDIVPDTHRRFLNECLDFVEVDTHFFVHGNYLPDIPLAELDPEILRWRSLGAFMPGPHQNGKVAVVGHTADESGEILDVGYLKCIDTYCYGGRWLTAIDVTTGQLWQTNENGELRDG